MSDKDLFLGGPLPFFLALLLAGLLSRSGSPLRRALGAALGVLAGYLAFHLHLIGFLQPWQRSSMAAVRAHEWLAWLVPLAAGTGIVLGGRRAPALLRLGLPATLGTALLTATLYPKIKDFWDTGTSAAAMAGLFGVWLLGWASMQAFNARRGSASTAALLGLVGLCGAASSGLTGTLSYAQLLGALTAALAAVALLGLFSERKGPLDPSLAAGALPSGLTVIALLLLSTSEPVYGELPVLDGLLLIAPLVLAGPLGRLGGRSIPKDLARVALLLTPALVAVGRIVWAWMERQNADPYGY